MALPKAAAGFNASSRVNIMLLMLLLAGQGDGLLARLSG